MIPYFDDVLMKNKLKDIDNKGQPKMKILRHQLTDSFIFDVKEGVALKKVQACVQLLALK